jgi:flagellar hook-associated protein 3 FlgL
MVSSAFRITQRSVSNTMMSGLQSNLGRLQKFQEQLSSGKQMSRPSDSPVQTVEALQFRSTIRRTEQYVRNADDGLAQLSAADGALTDSLAMTRRVRDLVLTGMNDTVSPEGRAALAGEIEALRDGLVGVANTRYLDRPVFGGNTAATDAFSAAGSYQGDDGAVLRTVGAGVQVPVNVTGAAVFGADGEQDQLFAVLDGLAAALRGPAPGMHAALGAGLLALDTGIDRIITALGDVGARTNRLDTVKAAAESQIDSLASSLSEVEDIDLPKTIVELQMQEVAYKAALGATARVVQPSLLDFLR